MMYSDSYKVDILFLIEHRDRELDAICAVAKILKAEYGLSVAIASLLFHSLVAAVSIRPKVVVVPFAYSSCDFPVSLFRAIYGDKIIYVNMNLEQFLSPVNKEYKKPRDRFARLTLKHFCWGEFFKDYLLVHGVAEQNIYITGNPATSLLKNIASRHRDSLKRSIAERFNLPPSHKWIFFPMNCGWAFTSDYHIRARIKIGYDEQKARTYKKYISYTLDIIFRWIADIKDVAKEQNITIILRPHPSVSVRQYEERFNNVIGYVPDYVRIIKDLTAKEWVIVCNSCYTNFSTVALDAQLIGKVVYLMEPEPYPSFLQMDWYKGFPKVASFTEFRASLGNNSPIPSEYTSILHSYIDMRLNGIFETAKYLAEFVKERSFTYWSPTRLLKGVSISPRQSIGGFVRMLAAVSGFNPFQVLRPGIKADFFKRHDVVKML